MATFAANESPIALLMIDADHFKTTTPTVIRAVTPRRPIAARIAKQRAARNGPCARYGGEEFAVLLPGETREGVYDAEEICASVVATCAATGAARRFPTVSVGVASMTPCSGWHHRT